MNFVKYMKHFERFVIDNSPVILTAIGVTGTLATALLAGRASFKAAQHLNDNWAEYGENLTVTEKVKEVWTLYIPAAGTAALTVAAIIGSNRISYGRATALAAALTISEKAFSDYKSKVLEHMGTKKEQTVRDELAQERLDRDPVSKKEVFITGNGDVLCYDSYTGRYFTSTMEKLRKAQNDINQQIIHDNSASLTDFFYNVGLKPTKLSDEVGWNLDQMLELDISAGLTDDSRPCLVIDFEVSPARNYFRCL